jgi:hypothetical protein
MRIAKARLDSQACDAGGLTNLDQEHGPKLPLGRIFTQGDRHNAYRWIKPLSQCLGARLRLTLRGKAFFRGSGGGSSQIRTRAGHASLKSSEPYLAENLDVTRDITARFVLVKHEPIRLESLGDTQGTSGGKGEID